MKNRIPPPKKRPGKMPQVRVWMHPFQDPQERQELLMNLAISREFDMRFRGLVEYYGKELIAYKREKPSDQKRNEFLRILSEFMTTCLEDNCPSSWEQCQPPFWEELIFTFYPHKMKISQKEKETEGFLAQLRKFVRWLDKRTGTSWYSTVNEYASDAAPDLKICEHLLNSIFLRDFPRLHHDEWDLEHDIEIINEKFSQCKDRLGSLFEVTGMIEDNIVLTEFNTNRTYYIKGLPGELIVPGLIMNGVIGKQKGEMIWNWFGTEGIYPQRGKKYIHLMS